ncbi:MAG: NUDIX domain-containing protein [Patescibacteria group bacterium]
MLNFLFNIVSSIRKCYWFFRRPVTVGVKILATSRNEILLIKNRYEKMWYLPGGEVKSGETLAESAKRELREECGIIPKDLIVFGIYTNFFEYKSDHIILMYADVSGAVPQKGLEIEELGFFDMKNLPENVSPATRRRLDEYLSGKPKTDKW